MRRAALVAAVLLLAVAAARSEDAIGEADLATLAEKALAAAVTSTGKSTFALDDSGVQAEGGGAKAEAVTAALRAASGKAGVKLVKHAENLEAPMLRVRFSTLVVSNAKESSVDHGLYIELEAATRAVIHANVTNYHKPGPGGRTAGHHSARTLDALADRFVSKWAEKPDPSRMTIVG